MFRLRLVDPAQFHRSIASSVLVKVLFVWLGVIWKRLQETYSPEKVLLLKGSIRPDGQRFHQAFCAHSWMPVHDLRLGHVSTERFSVYGARVSC